MSMIGLNEKKESLPLSTMFTSGQCVTVVDLCTALKVEDDFPAESSFSADV